MTLAETEAQILDALATIRRCWDALLPDAPGAIQSNRAAPKRLYVHDDNDERTDDLPRVDANVSLRHEVMLSLNGWARVVMEDRPVTRVLPPGTDTLALATFLERHARWFSGHEAARDAADELTTWAAKVRAVAEPRRRDWIVLGDCPFVVEDWFCHGQVRWYDDPERDPSCTDCGQTAVVEWWEVVLGVSRTVQRDDLASFIGRHTGRKPSRVTLWRWIKGGIIQPCGTDEAGRELFDRGAVVFALTQRAG